MIKSRSKPYALNKNKYLLDYEYSRLYEILDSFEHRDVRNVLLLKMALSTGARATELLNIKKSDFDVKGKSVLLYGIKGSNDREIPLESKLFSSLQNYIQNNGDNMGQFKKRSKPKDELITTKDGRRLSRGDEFLFDITYPRLVQIWLNYRPVEKSFHALRHTFAIRLYKKTRDIRLLQFALGHRNIANTMIYADYVYSQDELRKLIL